MSSIRDGMRFFAVEKKVGEHEDQLAELARAIETLARKIEAVTDSVEARLRSSRSQGEGAPGNGRR